MTVDRQPRALPIRWSRGVTERLSLAVIGGSTPFASRLVSALDEVREPGAPASDGGLVWDLRLLGRDPVALTAIEGHARSVLGEPHSVLATDDLGAALDGADVVLVQPRIGGLAERAIDEELAASVAAPADEGLGPGGLRAIIRATPALRGLARDLRRRAPEAAVIAFSNPLSSTVSILSGTGVEAAGVCELPLVTAHEIASVLEVPREELSWRFTGLSHRGFIHRIELDGTDRFAEVVGALRAGGRRDIGGIDVDVIEDVGAVPLKYHAMLSGTKVPAAGRGRELLGIRNEALAELADDPAAAPAALAKRSMPWYHEAVLPILLALAGRPLSATGPHVLDLVCDDGLVREVLSDVSPAGAAPLQYAGPTSPDAQAWLGRFEAHERALNRFLADPTQANLAEVLTLDPATPTSAVDQLMPVLSPLVAGLLEQQERQTWLRA